jgi:hypothetical protein
MSDSSTAQAWIGRAAVLSNNLNFRDKSVKTLQYASRMLLGYYGKSMSAATENTLLTVTSQCSQGRKVFRLLKSVNMLSSLTGMISSLGDEGDDENEADQSDVNVPAGIDPAEETSMRRRKRMCRKYAKHCEALELACMLGYFACDNVLFLGRSKIITNSYNAQFWERATFFCWAANDLVALSRICTLLWGNHKEKVYLEEKKKKSKSQALSAGVACSPADVAATATIAAGRAGEDEESQIAELLRQRKQLIRSLFKSLFELGVSGGHCMHSFGDTALVRLIDRYTPLYRLFGQNAPRSGHVGLCGTLSSLMTMQDILGWS